MEIASLNQLQDHSTFITSKLENSPQIHVPTQSSSHNTNQNSDSESSQNRKQHKNHKTHSESSESDKQHKNPKRDNDSSESDKEHKNYKSDSESSESDKEHKNHKSDNESSKSDKEHKNHKSDKESSKSDKEHKNHKSDSESSESDKEHTNHKSDNESSESDKEHKNHKSDNESSKSDKVHKNRKSGNEPSKSDKEHKNRKSDNESSESDKKHKNHKSDSESSESDKEPTNHKSDKEHTNHNSDSESSESEKELEGNFATRKPVEKETDVITNDLKQPPSISTTAEECFKNTNDNMDYCKVSESSKIDKVREVFNFTTSQPLENETDLVTNDLKQSPLISTTFEECPKIDEVNHTRGNKSLESDKEQDDFDSFVEQFSKNKTEECSKTDEGAYEYATKDTNDDMAAYSNIIEEPFDNGKEQEILKFAIIHSSDKEIEIATDDLKSSPLINKIVEECPKSDEADNEYAIKNTNDDIDHSNTSEPYESTTRQPLEKETDIVTDDDLKPSPLTRNIDEEFPKIYKAAYECTTKNINDDMEHNNISESFESDRQQGVFLNVAGGQGLKMEPDIISNPVEVVKKSSSDEGGQNLSLCCDDLEEGFSCEFNITRAFRWSGSMECIDGSNVGEIEGESMVDRLKRQVEYDKKCIHCLYKELEEERSASEVAASQAMAMITRLQDEKAAMQMEALHYLRMMEEQAENDVEALEKSTELVRELERELEQYRCNYLVNTIVEGAANEEHMNAENDIDC